MQALEAFTVSTGIVALAEMGDKTQLLALLLAARFKRPWPIVAGIFVATVLNHALAGALGAWLMSVSSPLVMRWVLGLGFLAMAAWMLIPDKIDEAEAEKSLPKLGVFAATLIAFFIAEMGDKTQIATVALAASAATTSSAIAVVIGTTLGMMLANVPAVFLGAKLAAKIPIQLVHRIAAASFAALGLLTLLGAGQKLGL